MQRGNIKEVSKTTKDNYIDIVHKELDVKALRLAPYVLVKAMDHAPLQREHIDEREKEILKDWQNKLLLKCYPYNQPVIFKNDRFYKLITDMIYEAYIPKCEEDLY